MSIDVIIDRLRTIIAEQFTCAPEKIGPQTVATDVLGWDSLSHTVLLLKVEDAFGIELPEDEIFDIKNVAELAELIERVCG